MDLLARALGALSAGTEKLYFDGDADGAAARDYYAGVDPEQGGTLARLLEETHRDRPRYSPTNELYGWVDLQPDRMVRSIYTLEEFDPKLLIEEAARIHEQREALRATAASEAAVEELEPYNCEHVVRQSWFDQRPSRCAGTCTTSSPASASATASAGTRLTPTFPTTSRSFARAAARRRRTCSSPRLGKGPSRARPSTSCSATASCGPYSNEAIETLLQWHEAEPVSEYERHRNAAIFERQGNRNPLIDHPEWSSRIDFCGAAS